MTRRRMPPPRPRAELVLRLAVLLQAGLAPGDAWRHLAASGDEDAAAVVSDAAAQTRLAVAIRARGPSWVPLAAA
ncbi:MAG: pilus assembly protein TadB, partial [Microbacterium sp.]